MIEWIRYRFLMRRLRGEIARTVRSGSGCAPEQRPERRKSSFPTACKACGSIV